MNSDFEFWVKNNVFIYKSFIVILDKIKPYRFLKPIRFDVFIKFYQAGYKFWLPISTLNKNETG
ncbi:hypothetical protein BOQ62_15270 [Chryseobacterium sp. CH21]|nr:hypothetical protein BOQ62_15270 [Chryseobacterium sp. CH21]